LGGAFRPRLLEHLVRRAPEQDAARSRCNRANHLAHLEIKAIAGGPGWSVDDTVQAHELVDMNGSHGVASSCIGPLFAYALLACRQYDISRQSPTCEPRCYPWSVRRLPLLRRFFFGGCRTDTSSSSSSTSTSFSSSVIGANR